MKPDDILDMIGDAKGEHIIDAQQVRSGGVPAKARKLPPRKLWLIAAMIALMLLLVGCTIAYAKGWFVEFFANKSEAPLSDSQIALIEAKEQQIRDSQTQNGWTVELRSAIRDGSKALVIIGIAAPEGVDLEPEVVDDVSTERFSPGNDGLASDQEGRPSIIGVPEGIYLSSVQTRWEEDGDNLDNTKNYVIELMPDITGSSADPFGADAVWSIHIEDIVRTYDDAEYKQMLLDTKYKGDYGVMFTHEETLRMRQREVLAEGIWDFTVTFADQDPGLAELELLTAPIQTGAEILKRYGDGIFDSVHVQENVTVTSIRLQSLSAVIAYEPCGGVPTFYFDDGDIDQSDIVYVYCVLRDGSRITLQDMGGGGDGYKLLDADSPLVLEEVDHILLPDGTRVYTDGTIEYADKAALPAAALDYQDIASETGVYAYYADFDQDSVEDMGIWYDGAFHALCLLNENGEAKKVFPFENGMDVFETYNQRAAQIKHEPNQIRILETEGDGSTLRLFRAEADGLYLSVGVRYAPNGADGKWFQAVADPSAPYDPSAENWEMICEEAYRRIVEDYQVMQYRLIPIQ